MGQIIGLDWENEHTGKDDLALNRFHKFDSYLDDLKDKVYTRDIFKRD